MKIHPPSLLVEFRGCASGFGDIVCGMFNYEGHLA